MFEHSHTFHDIQGFQAQQISVSSASTLIESYSDRFPEACGNYHYYVIKTTQEVDKYKQLSPSTQDTQKCPVHY